MRLPICAALLFTPVISQADQRFRRVQRVCNVPTQVVQVQDHFIQPQIQYQPPVILNNLIGIPVPIQYDQPLVSQGSTVFGYSSVQEAHGNVDLGLLYSQAARLTDQAQQLAGQAHTDFSALVQIEGNNRADVAKIIAQGQAAAEALSAVRVQESTQATQTKFSLTTRSGVSQSARSSGVSNVLVEKCVSCHSNGNAQGGLNLEAPITQDQAEASIDRAITDDLTKRMPRNADGSVGSRLNISEMKDLINSLGE